MTPWILKDFRSARRTLPHIEDYFNRKGLVSDLGEKKKSLLRASEVLSGIAECSNGPDLAGKGGWFPYGHFGSWWRLRGPILLSRFQTLDQRSGGPLNCG